MDTKLKLGQSTSRYFQCLNFKLVSINAAAKELAAAHNEIRKTWPSNSNLYGCSHTLLPKLREKYLYIPAKVTKHARQFFLKIPKIYKKEVEMMQTGWAGILEAALAMG